MNGDLLEAWGAPQPSGLARAIAQRRAAGAPLRDLVSANPQEEGFEFDQELLAGILRDAAEAARFYRPDPRGQSAAREAVAEYHGGAAPESLLLTPGTSIAYWYAFRLLAADGGEVLCPSPTYPLFDDLARVAGARVRRYHLRRDGARWAMDPEELAFQVTPQTRAIVVVSPHNPTGTVASSDELAALAEVARRHGLAVIFDEVFREFVHAPTTREQGAVRRVPRPAECGVPLALTLNGLSKMLSLPGMKAGWMVAEGEDEALHQRFLNAAEYLSDTLLPVSELTQAAMPRLLREGTEETARFAALCTERMRALAEQWAGMGFPVGLPEGGPYLVVPVAGDGARLEEGLLRLVRERGIVVHAGGLYGIEEPSIVMTCIARPPVPVREIIEVAGILGAA
jgi:alanine-synthesizing transaminase